MPRTTRDPDPPLPALSGVHGGVHFHAKDLQILQNILADPLSSAFAGSSASIYPLLPRDTAESTSYGVQSEVGPVLVNYPLPDMAVIVSTYFSQPQMYTCTYSTAYCRSRIRTPPNTTTPVAKRRHRCRNQFILR